MIRRRRRKSTHPLKPANLKSNRQRELSNAALRFPGYSVKGCSEFSSCELHHVEGCRTSAYFISFLLHSTSPINSNTPQPPARPILQGPGSLIFLQKRLDICNSQSVRWYSHLLPCNYTYPQTFSFSSCLIYDFQAQDVVKWSSAKGEMFREKVIRASIESSEILRDI